ncbi:hypothetical protein HNQ02_003736 [Flavobacterium sp. 7E]|uniref:hypothetical protein n=1 Tax=Flavobacterium sp. 7E TaxID=2735898 RepID=UPI00156D7C9C|nr:hypothetical protein [Flavobacterium sp. 7E]NRS90789.1 hypothetical protein [Flavobacterium sp. 7E]
MKKCLVLILLCLSCNVKSKKEFPCVTKMEYMPFLAQSTYTPEYTIKIYVEDNEEILQKKIGFKKLKNIILYSIKVDDRGDFRLYDLESIYDKNKNNILVFKIFTSYFVPNIYINGIKKENKWMPQQIQKAIEGDVGFVFEKDTIRVKMCQK